MKTITVLKRRENGADVQTAKDVIQHASCSIPVIYHDEHGTEHVHHRTGEFDVRQSQTR